MRRAGVIGMLAAAALAGCGGGAKTSGTATGETSRRAAAPQPRLTSARPCPNARSFTCSTLTVPLDHSGRTPGPLRLAVAAADNADAPRGALVVLTGGPGQGGVDFVPRVRARMRALLRSYRMVMFDQRGTGGGALRCPALQRAVGTSDLTVPPRGAVEACARKLGSQRAFYSTADTVADLEALRLALDSVVPARSVDGLEVDGMHETARVLRAVCRAQHCSGDPAADLAAVVRARHDGPELDDTLVALSVGAPTFPGVIAALREARAGHPQHLERIVRVVRQAQRAPAPVLSQGLHAATLCADLRPPWGNSAAPLAGREAAVRRAAARVDPAPYDRATVVGNGL